MSPELLSRIEERLERIEADLATLKAAAALQTKLGFNTSQAAFLTGLSEEDLRKRALSPPDSPHHIKVVRKGEKRPRPIFPRSELERLLRDSAQ